MSVAPDSPSTPAEPAPREWRTLAWPAAVRHSGLVISATLVLFSAYQIMALASWNEETAQAIVQEQGSVQILTGTLLALLAAVTPIALLGAILLPFARWLAPMEVAVTTPTALVIAATGLVLAAAALPISGLVILAVLGGTCALGAGMGNRQARKRNAHNTHRTTTAPISSDASSQPGESRHEGREPTTGDESLDGTPVASRTFTQMLLVLTVLSTAILLVDHDPWMPRENLSFTDHTHDVGYVLSNDSDDLVFIDYTSHLVHHRPASSVASRSICEWTGDRSIWGKRLFDLGTHRDNYPACALPGHGDG